LLVGFTIVTDLAMIFATSALVTEPAYYERTLFLSLCIIQLAQFSFGRAAAVLGIVGSVVAYSALTFTANRVGADLAWSQQIWALGCFVLACTAFMLIHGNFRERVARIAALFERAETGDFSVPFVAGVRSYPDAITHLGESYNRVRLQLAEMVLTDPLSACLNRRGFDQQLARELARGARSGRPIALLAIDVDHFKRINDDFGHLTGDAVIREIGQLLRDTARAGDVVARMGGEEFMVLALDTDEQGALQLGDRLCLAFRSHNFASVEGMSITVSVGVVAETAQSHHIAADLRGRADEALYTAKQRGRDQVCFWTQGMRPFRNSPAVPMQKYVGESGPQGS
jgi:diguanylate cyclase (GGDEF)-like protein